MPDRVYMDFETKSHADLKQTGAWVYSQHHSTEIVCLAFHTRHANGSFEKGVWVPGDPEPARLLWAIRAGYSVEAHNCSFEWSIWENICVALMGWPAIRLEQWRDTMAVACYYAMPPALDALCRAIGIPGKDPEGSRLITKYSKLYLKSAKAEIPPEDLEKFKNYCKRDVELEMRISDYFGELPEAELENFHIDLAINREGFQLDGGGIAAAAKIVDEYSARLTERFREITGFNPTQNAKLIEWFGMHGLKLANMQADYLEDLIEEGSIPPGKAREALDIRLELNKASTKKLDGMARNTDSAGRARFQNRYHGAQTGRQTASGFGNLNLAKPWEDVEPEMLVRDIKYGASDWLKAIYDDPMAAVSKASRHWIVAKPGHRIMAGDFSSIEAVVLACLAGENWKVEAFREGKKIYELMADKIYGLPAGTVAKKTHPGERADGKIAELAFGYQGSLGAWLNMTSKRQDTECFSEAQKRAPHTDERILEINRAWRAAHPATVAFWKGMEDAAIEAMHVGHAVAWDIQFHHLRDEGFLAMELPNGKRIWYRAPELRVGMPRRHQPETEEACALGTCECRPRPFLTYMAQKTGQWRRVSTYGGKLTENAVQATAREYLRPAIKAARDAGYKVIFSVYDEIVAEVPDGWGSLEEFLGLMRAAPGREWAGDWPIGVDGWEGKVYTK